MKIKKEEIMLRKIVVVSLVVCMYCLNAHAENNYLYRSVCPPNLGYNPDGITRNTKMHGGPINNGWWQKVYDKNGNYLENKSYWADKWNFAQCECTSYVAYRMNNPFNDSDIGEDTDPIYGVPFSNGYKAHWGDGGKWWSAGKKLGIADNNPIPGDAVCFVGGNYGHIAFVEKVKYDANMNWKKITLSEYNVEGKHRYKYGRVIVRGDKRWLYNPKGFIHILAYANPEFYFNYYDLGYDFAGQTKEEWEKIYVLVMQKYYQEKNDPRYQSSYQAALNHIGGSLPVGFGGTDGNPGYQTIPSPDDTQNEGKNLPDFIIRKLTLTDSYEREKYTFFSDEILYMQAYAKNIGKADWAGEANNISLRFYLSKGYKEDNHSEWHRVGIQEIQKGHLDQGETKHESDRLHLDNLKPGIYNIVACADRNKDDHNEDGEVPEIHKSNNCSTEAVFKILSRSSYANSPCGKAGFTKQKCIQIIMTLISNLNK